MPTLARSRSSKNSGFVPYTALIRLSRLFIEFMAELQRPRDFLKVMWGAQFVSIIPLPSLQSQEMIGDPNTL